MTRRTRPDGAEPPPPDAGFDFGSPRWREPDASAEILAGKQRRFRNDLAPDQRGSIDAAGSVPSRPAIRRKRSR